MSFSYQVSCMTMQAVKAVYVYAIPHGFTKCTMSWYQKIMLKAHDSVLRKLALDGNLKMMLKVFS